jgi:hypothetical protein
MKPMVIDVAGTVEQFVKWVLAELLFLLGLIAFGLSAPLLFTVGIEILAWSGSNMQIWGVLYFLLGPFACAIWMVFICHWHSVRQWQRAGKLKTWRQDHGGIFQTVGKAVWFMFSGLFGSVLAEVIFCIGFGQVFPHRLNPQYLSPADAGLVFAIAPFFVFAPALLVLLSRWIRRDEYAISPTKS